VHCTTYVLAASSPFSASSAPAERSGRERWRCWSWSCVYVYVWDYVDTSHFRHTPAPSTSSFYHLGSRREACRRARPLSAGGLDTAGGTARDNPPCGLGTGIYNRSSTPPGFGLPHALSRLAVGRCSSVQVFISAVCAACMCIHSTTLTCRRRASPGLTTCGCCCLSSRWL
jgi:hypothetical protein